MAKRSFNAFTVLEMTITMLLMAIIVSMAAYFMHFFYREARVWRLSQRQMLEINRSLAQLEWDVQQAETISLLGDELQCINGRKVITYKLDGALIREQQGQHDTLGLPLRSYEVSHVREIPLVDSLWLHFDYNTHPITAMFSKEYAAEQILKLRYGY